ncbi:MAG TPA: glycosyltransferase N-terminal domain-containing protein [Paracoccus sp. (in: a-proteobacteria)]|nr:glycosyltransferase N-terminal domain-containing protein [Paracoccus sp. (in: a-proteobacteria)]
MSSSPNLYLLIALAPLAGPDWRERLVLDAGPEHVSGGVWLHGASVGELNSVRPLVQALAAQMPVLVTANTVTGRGVAQGWGLPARLAPLDVPGAVRRFLDAARRALMLTVENEIWPNRAAAALARGIPQAVIGARMSARSARGWGRARGLIGPVLAALDLLSAQDADSESRLLALGLPPHALAPRLNLKLLGPAAVAPPAEDPRRAHVWLAASTHQGEEAAILAAHAALRRSHPDLRLILAPRHPRR